MADEEKGRVLGYGPCPTCGASAPYKVNKKGHLYVYCPTEADGGCHSGSQSRAHKGDVEKAKRITKWNNPEDRKKYLGEAEAAPEKISETSFWNRSIF